MYLTRRVVLPGLAGSGWGEHFCPKGQDPWHPRDPRPGWVCVFKQELLDWPLHLGDREVRTLKPMSQKNSSEKSWLLANVRSAGTGGGGAESQRKSDSHSVRSPFQPCLGSCLREDEGGLGLAAEFRHAKASELQGRKRQSMGCNPFQPKPGLDRWPGATCETLCSLPIPDIYPRKASACRSNSSDFPSCLPLWYPNKNRKTSSV